MVIKESIAHLAVLSFYSLVRHTMYLSTLLLFRGMPVALRSVISLCSCKKVFDVCIFMMLYIPVFPCTSAMELALEEGWRDMRSVNSRADIGRYRLSGESVEMLYLRTD